MILSSTYNQIELYYNIVSYDDEKMFQVKKKQNISDVLLISYCILF